jgi:hypothetical protein
MIFHIWLTMSCAGNLKTVLTSGAEPHHFNAAPGKNFDAAPAPTLLYSKAKFLTINT